MSFEPDEVDHNVTVVIQNDRIIQLLKAVLAGIEIIADQEEGSLIENVDEDS